MLIFLPTLPASRTFLQQYRDTATIRASVEVPRFRQKRFADAEPATNARRLRSAVHDVDREVFERYRHVDRFVAERGELDGAAGRELAPVGGGKPRGGGTVGGNRPARAGSAGTDPGGVERYRSEAARNATPHEVTD